VREREKEKEKKKERKRKKERKKKREREKQVRKVLSKEIIGEGTKSCEKNDEKTKKQIAHLKSKLPPLEWIKVPVRTFATALDHSEATKYNSVGNAPAQLNNDANCMSDKHTLKNVFGVEK
jgi:hypothetical protein